MFENKVCPVCFIKFKEGDDVVVCPDCGTPHHRECWEAHGTCAHQEKHVSGYQYGAEEKAKEEAQEAALKAELEKTTHTQEGVPHICTRCGGKLIDGLEFCIMCGQKRDEPVESTAGLMQNLGKDPLGGVPANEEIAGVPAAEMAEVVRINSHKYLPKFKKLDGRKLKAGWNWPALFFPKYFFFYRKMYAVGAAVLVISYLVTNIVNMLMGDPTGAFFDLYEKVSLNYSQSVSVAAENMDVIWRYLLLLLITYIPNLFWGVAANYIYMRKCASIVSGTQKQMNTAEKGKTLNYHVQVIRRGGINLFAIFLGLFGNYLLLYIHDLVLNLF